MYTAFVDNYLKIIKYQKRTPEMTFKKYIQPSDIERAPLGIVFRSIVALERRTTISTPRPRPAYERTTKCRYTPYSTVLFLFSRASRRPAAPRSRTRITTPHLYECRSVRRWLPVRWTPAAATSCPSGRGTARVSQRIITIAIVFQYCVSAVIVRE